MVLCHAIYIWFSAMSAILEYSGLKWIENWSNTMIDELHLRLEAPSMDLGQTNLYRGQIQAARRVAEDAKRAYGAGDIREIHG